MAGRGEGGGGSLMYAACGSAILPIWSGPRTKTTARIKPLFYYILYSRCGKANSLLAFPSTDSNKLMSRHGFLNLARNKHT